jgi:transcriptional regulator with XRE-family HTH domain
MELFSATRQNVGMRRALNALLLPQMRPDQVGRRITAIRQTLAMNKKAFAEAAGVDASSLTKIEKGDMGLDIMVGARIAELYGFGLDFIYRGDLDDVPLDQRSSVKMRVVQPFPEK